MSLHIVIMFTVAAIFTLIGIGLLLALLRPAGPAKVYVYRMVGIMAVALGVVLAVSANAMWHWSTQS